MTRIRFRFIFPVLMTALHLFIVARSLQSNRGSQAQREKVVADSQEAGVVTFSPGPPEPSWRLLMALMLNLPAVYAGVPVALLLRCGGDIGLLSCSIPFVPPLWYAIGRRLDVRTGAFQATQRAHSSKWHTVRAIFRFFAACMVIVSVLALLNSHHRTVKRDFGLGILFAWFATYLLCTFWLDRRDRKRAPVV